MELRQLYFVVAAAHAQSFAKAADACFTTRQNVSRAIKELEGELGLSIFVRKGNSVLVTPMGEAVVSHAERIIDLAESMRALGKLQPGEQVQLKMAVSLNVLSGALAKITSLVDGYIASNRILELSCKECYERVCAKDVDAAIVMSMERAFPECLSTKVASSAAYLIVGQQSPLAAKSYCALSDLKDVNFVLMPDPAFQYAPLFEFLEGFGVDERQVNISPSTSTMLHIIKRTDNAAALVPVSYAASTPPGTAVIPIIDSRLNWHTYVLFWPNPETYVSITELARKMQTELK